MTGLRRLRIRLRQLFALRAALLFTAVALVGSAHDAHAQAPARGDVFYATTGGSLLSIDPSNGAVSVIGSPGGPAMAIDPTSRRIYAVNGSGLVILDGVTAAATVVGPTPLCRGMAFDPSGNLYAVRQLGYDLLSIDPATGATSVVTTLSFEMAGMSFDPTSGLLYGGVGGGTDGSLYRIDPSTWQAELVGANTFSLSALAFDSTGQLWGIQRMTSSSGDLFVRIDKDTAAVTVIGNTGLDGGTSLDIVSPVPPTPPEIASIIDIGNDQGRQVRITVLASNLDEQYSEQPILRYVVFRRIDPLPMARRIPGWDQVAVIEAFGEPLYNTVVPTLADSTVVDGQYWSVFKVRAATAEPTVFFESLPDSGYSLDNLAPAPPAGLAFVGSTSLGWDDALEQDFAHHTVYASDSAVLDGTAIVLGETTSPNFDVAGSAAMYFHVTTTDLSGNESGEATLASQVTPAPPLAGRTHLEQNSPNPFNPSTTIRFQLAQAGEVELTIYDQAGHRVRTLVREPRTAGPHEVSWNGVDANGQQVASGVYLCKLTAGAYVQTQRMTLLK